jgi:hypothetical protein
VASRVGDRRHAGGWAGGAWGKAAAAHRDGALWQRHGMGVAACMEGLLTSVRRRRHSGGGGAGLEEEWVKKLGLKGEDPMGIIACTHLKHWKLSNKLTR